jgi:DNA-binding transcriptional LysR family regulator
MEIRQLRYFAAVADERHFRRAAARLHVAQPAVSEQIRKLEAELGTILLIRGSRSVELTAAGAAFLDEAQHILRGVDGAALAAKRAEAGTTAKLRVGYTLPALPRPVTDVLARLQTARTRVGVDVAAGASRTLLERVRRGELDAAVVCLPAPTSGLRTLQLTREPLMVVLPGRADAPAPPVPLSVASGRLLLPARDLDPACHDATLAAFHAVGAVPQVVASAAADLEHLLLEVLAGAGVAVLPASAAARGGVPGLAAHPIADLEPSVPMAVVVRDEAPAPVLSRLLDELARAADAPVTPLAALAPVAA